jgi:hypothetical protein
MKLGQAAKGETNFTLSQANSNRDAVEDSDGLSLGDDQASAFNPFLAPIAHPHSGHTLLTAESTEANEWPLDTSKGKMSAKHAGPESLAQNNQPALPQTTTGMRKAKAGNNRFGFFNQNPSNGNNPNIQPGFLPGYAINPTTGQAYVKTKNGLQAINDQGAEEIAPEMYVLSAGDAIEATKLGLSAAKVGMDMLNNIAESALPAVKKGSAALAKKFGMWEDTSAETADSVPNIHVSPKHPLEGWTPQDVIEYANKLGLKTPRDQLILWSGLGRGKAGVILSQEYALANGGMTLEMTSGGKWLNEMNLFGNNSPFTRIEAGRIWEGLSEEMIRHASGQVRSLIGTVSPTSIYRAEQSEILMNDKISGLDELNLKPRYSFQELKSSWR